jgi:hypothetical protein
MILAGILWELLMQVSWILMWDLYLQGSMLIFVVLFHDHVIESDAQYKYGPINEVIHKAGCQRSFLLEGHGLALCSWCHSISSCSPVCIYRPGNPVPITLQSLAVLALLIVLGSHLGMGAVLLYLLGGTCGLPIFDGGSSGHHILLTDKSSGYL